jgi:FKBP-type peptidyl-prolyl cis-trans isomerase
LGYGGIRSGKIPPFSGLIFEVELIAVNPEVPPKN